MRRDIDWSFVGKREGGRQLKAYVPPDDKEGKQAGVTVATGVDLGQRGRQDLIRLGIPDALKRKLMPYLLVKADDARALILRHPLILNPLEAEALDLAVEREIVNTLVRRFDRDSKIPFDRIPGRLRTVLVSLAWNFGAGLWVALPTGWRHATEIEIPQLIAYLEDESNWRRRSAKLIPRRKAEAEYLRALL